ncbi:hypothetical protein PV367_06400 [Streptomyces europaeiscabiei]|uniref:Uncharacterized protein n=1 Tax=Streptomyces europaeiscabiei TaxID=146819 RepID=A0AAJ2PLN2_9ACTN|nr:hypothetical protein [Streptomyces europaeiscabiei]MDX3129443.1 hypothetical protein [Streptomyces europaeiscabiei]
MREAAAEALTLRLSGIALVSVKWGTISVNSFRTTSDRSDRFTRTWHLATTPDS